MTFSEQTKKFVRKKAHMSCCICHQVGVEVHHIIPVEKGGPDIFDNAAPLCPTCHGLYGANPRKRNFILEARDNWYEICERMYLSEESNLKDLKDILEQTASKEELLSLFDEVKKINLALGHGETGKIATLSEVLNWIYDTDIQKIPIKDIKFLFNIIFEEIGCDPLGSLEEFLRLFGRESAMRLCAKAIHEREIDFSHFTRKEFYDVYRGLITDAFIVANYADTIDAEGLLEIINLDKGDEMKIRIAIYCHARTASGKLCGRKVTRPNKYCWQHMC